MASPSPFTQAQWIWHPEWSEDLVGPAGGFVHFRKAATIETIPTEPVRIHITADTRYKLFVNSTLVHMGPVKGDERLWFYDEVDIQPYLQAGANYVSVRVLRFHYATSYATSFPRLPYAGLFIRNAVQSENPPVNVQTDSTWETALDLSSRLRVDLKEDDFLHVYEDVDYTRDVAPIWVQAKCLNFPSSHGLTAPWNLSARMIPPLRLKSTMLKGIRNIKSTLPPDDWQNVILSPPGAVSTPHIHLPAGSTHRLELEAHHHLTAMISFHFQRPTHSGGTLRVVYSECYEEEPDQIPYLRCKGDRCDSTKQLIGPEDKYKFGGVSTTQPKFDAREVEDEIFVPFHFRTFRFLVVEIQAGQDSDLIFKGIELSTINYPLETRSQIRAQSLNTTDSILYNQIWDTSLRTLQNCLHDTYEDCPFYEQLQYAMDTRSSILFTYCVSGDDRLARQAIIQLHNSYQPHIGLTGSRAPSQQLQIIPHFSLFWICMVADHFQYSGDADFVRQFLSACDGVLESFYRRIDPQTGLVRSVMDSPHWDFVDWTDPWRPMGIPQAAARTGFCSFTSMLYAYTLNRAANLLLGIGRGGLAAEYRDRAQAVVQAIQTHCFDGRFYTDGLASMAIPSQDYSQHSQIWAVLCGCASGTQAAQILQHSLSTVKEISPTPTRTFAPVSIAMSFYTLRALSLVGGTLYNELFHGFWEPWKAQLGLNLTTWMEDTVSQRSDCHAWGSTALYEFPAEVAGIQPAEPGWAKIAFQPRVSLFPTVEISVPFGCKWDTGQSQTPRRPSGIAHVKWHTEDNGTIVLSLKLEMDADTDDSDLDKRALPAPPPVLLAFPDGTVEEVYDSSSTIVRTINL